MAVDVGRLGDRKAPVFAGNLLTTDAPGNVLLDYQSRERCVVRGDTSLVVQTAGGGGDALTLEQGGQDSVVCTDLSAHLTIDTTLGTFQATGTTFSISRAADGSVTVRVLDGSGTLTSKTPAQQAYRMAAGDEGTIRPAGTIAQSVVTGVRPTEGEAMAKLKVSARPPLSSAQFNGTALANGKVVPQGSVIEARVGNQVCGTTQVSNRDGSYSLVVHSAEVQPGCGTKDAPVSLVVVPVAPQATPVATQVPFKAGVQPTVRLNLTSTSLQAPQTQAPSR
jgi:hypothetical protein